MPLNACHSKAAFREQDALARQQLLQVVASACLPLSSLLSVLFATDFIPLIFVLNFGFFLCCIQIEK